MTANLGLTHLGSTSAPIKFTRSDVKAMRGKLGDIWRFTAKLNTKKVFNLCALLLSYYASKISGRVIHRGMLASLSVEPTTSCNLRCPECVSGLRSFTRPTGVLSWALFKKLVDEAKEHLMYLNLYFQGEPYLHPEFLKLVAYATQNRIYTATSTNGHFLTDDNARETVTSGLDRLIISIDGATQESYEAYRIGGRLDKVLSGVANVVKWKNRLKSPTPYVVLQMLVVKQNEQEIQLVRKLAKQSGADELKLKTAQIYDYQHGSGLIPEQLKFSRYLPGSDGTWKLKNKLLNECWKMWHSAVVTWDGKMVPCCFDKDAAHKLGDTNTNSLQSIWESSSYQEFRGQILKARNQIEICRNCSQGGPVWA